MNKKDDIWKVAGIEKKKTKKEIREEKILKAGEETRKKIAPQISKILDAVKLDPPEKKTSNKPKKQTKPIDPKRKKIITKLNKRYLELKDGEELTKNKCLDILEKEFSQWKRSTISTYIKK